MDNFDTISFVAPYYKSADYQTCYPAYLRSVAPPPIKVDIRNELHPKQFRDRHRRKTTKGQEKTSKLTANNTAIVNDDKTSKRKSVTRKKHSQRRSRVNTDIACPAANSSGDDICVPSPSVDDYYVKVRAVEIYTVVETSSENNQAHISCNSHPISSIFSTTSNISLPSPSISSQTPFISPSNLESYSLTTSIPSRTFTAEPLPIDHDNLKCSNLYLTDQREANESLNSPKNDSLSPPPKSPVIKSPQLSQELSYTLPPPSPLTQSPQIIAPQSSQKSLYEVPTSPPLPESPLIKSPQPSQKLSYATLPPSPLPQSSLIITPQSSQQSLYSVPPPPPLPQSPLIKSSQSSRILSHALPVPSPPPLPPKLPTTQIHRVSAGSDDGHENQIEMCKRTAKRFEMECCRRRRFNAIHEEKTLAKTIAEQARDVAFNMAAKRMSTNNDNCREVPNTSTTIKSTVIVRYEGQQKWSSEYKEMERLGLGKCDDNGCWIPNSRHQLKNRTVRSR